MSGYSTRRTTSYQLLGLWNLSEGQSELFRSFSLHDTFPRSGGAMLLHENQPNWEKLVGLELDQTITWKSFQYFKTQPHYNDPRVEWSYVFDQWQTKRNLLLFLFRSSPSVTIHKKKLCAPGRAFWHTGMWIVVPLQLRLPAHGELSENDMDTIKLRVLFSESHLARQTEYNFDMMSFRFQLLPNFFFGLPPSSSWGTVGGCIKSSNVWIGRFTKKWPKRTVNSNEYRRLRMMIRWCPLSVSVSHQRKS